jgi:hypothetical protein
MAPIFLSRGHASGTEKSPLRAGFFFKVRLLLLADRLRLPLPAPAKFIIFVRHRLVFLASIARGVFAFAPTDLSSNALHVLHVHAFRKPVSPPFQCRQGISRQTTRSVQFP